MKKALVNTLYTLALTIAVAQAETATTSAVATLQTSIDALGNTVTNQQALVSKLSNDIGTMADRIGTMADRIVTTEKLLADTLIVLTSNPDLTGGSSSNSVALTAPTDSSPALSRTVAPTITMVPTSSTYLLYASTEATFSTGNTIAIYIDSSTTLSSKWSQVISFYDKKTATQNFYLAIKRVDSSNTISSISNSVKVTF